MNSETLPLLSVLLVGLYTGTVAPTPVAAVTPKAEHIVAFVFDWDDNIFNMPTQIMLFHKTTGEQLGVSTAEFAVIREQIGKPGTKYADYELRTAADKGSLRFFGDSSEDGTRRFQMDIDAARKGKNWKGPVWKDFVSATGRPTSARHTSLITARVHAATTIHAALAKFAKQDVIKNAPPVDNIWPVSAPDFSTRFARMFGTAAPSGDAASPSARKAAVMEQMLDRIERTPLPANAPKVLSPEGNKSGRYHLWGFSDDDLGNFNTAVTVLQKGVNASRWSHIKITVFYTGTNRPEVKPHAVTLVPNAPPRPYKEGIEEWQNVLAVNDGALLKLVP